MPAKSKKQQNFMAVVKRYKKGELSPKSVGEKVRKAAMGMNMKQVDEFAETATGDLPKRTPVLKRSRKGLAKVKWI